MSDEEGESQCFKNSEVFTLNELLDVCAQSGKLVVTYQDDGENTKHLMQDSTKSPPPPSDVPPILTIVAPVNDNCIENDSNVPTNFSEVYDDAEDNENDEATPTNNIRRRKRVNKESWKSEIRKTKRMHGESYHGKRKEGEARKMGPPCVSDRCRKSRLRNCQEFDAEARKSLFEDFWSMDWGEKQAHVKSLIDKISTKQVRGTRKRTGSYVYYLKLNGKKKQVCKSLFQSTLNIKQKQLRGWLTGTKISRPKKGCNYPFSKKESVQAISIKNFLEDQPKLPSHYCRKSTSKMYLEPNFRTKKDVYRAYQEDCGNHNVQAASWTKFYRVLDQSNIGIYQPKKDKCDICCSFEVGNVSEEEKIVHDSRKTLARAEKEKAKCDALEGNCHAICMDVQAVQMSPVLNASSLYYKTKLLIHNFTIYNLATKEASCYLWNESEGQLVASTFASCLVKYLTRFENDNKTIVIFSDGCTCQNRNAFLATALVDFSIRTGNTVVQKFLEKGHTQMEVDSVHSTIERRMKGKTIYVPEDYYEVCRNARMDPNSQRYEVVVMTHNNFLDYAAKDKDHCISIRPGKNSPGQPCVTDIRQIKYNPNGEVYFKLHHQDDWTQMPRKKEQTVAQIFPPLYKARIPISKRKFKDLQDLLQVIPAKHHDFYNGLPK